MIEHEGLICRNCGKVYDYLSNDFHPKTFCSYKCNREWTTFHAKPNCRCVFCGKLMYLKPCKLKLRRRGPTCSPECSKKENWRLSKNRNKYIKTEELYGDDIIQVWVLADNQQ